MNSIDNCNEMQYRIVNDIKVEKVHNFEEVSRDGCLSVLPPKLEFTFEFGNFKIQEKILKVANYFSKSCPIQILPLETRYFRMENSIPKTWLNPGSVIEIPVIFAPNENREYNDVLRIRYLKDHVKQIKIHARTVINFVFPTTVNFGNVPLGRTAYYQIPIHPHVEKEFSFAILPSRGVSCVDIYPRWGRLSPGHKPVIIMIIYRPVRYISAHFQVRIFISDLCKTPHLINFYAYTCPGLLRDMLDKSEPEVQSQMKQKKNITTCYKNVKLASAGRDKIKYSASTVADRKLLNYKDILLKQCGYFPPLTLHAVNCVLNATVQRLFDDYELRSPLNSYLSKRMEQRTQKLMEFLSKVDCHYRKNERSKFPNNPKLNSITYTDNERKRIDIKMQRSQDWEDYNNLIKNSERVVWEQGTTRKDRQRILRTAQKHPMTNFTGFASDKIFSLHYYKLFPFLQAARKIVLKNRLINILIKLRKMTPKLIIQFEESIA